MKLTVHGTKSLGRIKPMHGVNNVPFVPVNYGNSRLFEQLKEAGIPFSRLHDTGGDWGGTHYVDVANVFPNFDADPEDIANYDFAFTDRLMEEIVRCGMEPFYRLGCSIENLQSIKAYHIYPPRDPLLWAKICEGIIRHYTEGWGGGYHFKIRYWEIWNEPDNDPDPCQNPMWKGTMEEYFSLYKIASVYLKERFPHLKIGGYGSCGFYAISQADYSGIANSTSRVDYFITFFHRFLQYLSDENPRCPLDFFSFHSYADIEDNVAYARYARAELDRFGFLSTELIFNEWNAGVGLRGTCQDAARTAAVMIALQDTPIHACMYYDAQVNSNYCGIFNPIDRSVFPAYYAFFGFNELYRIGSQVEIEGGANGFYRLGAWNGQEGALLMANPEAQAADVTIHFELGERWNCEPHHSVRVRRVDETHVFTEDRFDIRSSQFSMTIPGYGMALLNISL